MSEKIDQKSIFDDSLADLLHDLKQPLNLIKVIAQDVKLDVMKNRLKVDGLPDSMKEIEATVENMVSQIDEYRRRKKE